MMTGKAVTAGKATNPWAVLLVLCFGFFMTAG
jgi:hypothetical protein